jgi:hypothetical protein
MKKKTTPINLMVEPEVKKRLKDKAKALGLTLTAYLEKIANEPVVYLDENLKSFVKALKLNVDIM